MDISLDRSRLVYGLLGVVLVLGVFSGYSQMQIDTYQENITELEEEVEEKNSEVISKENTIDALEGEIDNSEDQIENLEGELEVLQSFGENGAFGNYSVTSDDVRFNLEEHPVIGNKSSENVITVFCTFDNERCAEFFNTEFPTIYEQQLAEGNYRLHFIASPIFGTTPARASECMYKNHRDTYWDFVTGTYEFQSQLNLSSKEDMASHAKRIDSSVSEENLLSCIENTTVRDNRDLIPKLKGGITRIPTIWVNGNGEGGYLTAEELTRIS